MAVSNNNSFNWFSDNASIQSIINDLVPATNVAPGPPGPFMTTASSVSASRPPAAMVAQWNIDEMSYVLKGEMATSGLVIPEEQRETMINTMTQDGFKGHIKSELCHQLVKDMMDKKLIEFTMSTDPSSGDNIYRARAYIMPDHLTKILREFIHRNT